MSRASILISLILCCVHSRPSSYPFYRFRLILRDAFAILRRFLARLKLYGLRVGLVAMRYNFDGRTGGSYFPCKVATAIICLTSGILLVSSFIVFSFLGYKKTLFGSPVSCVCECYGHSMLHKIRTPKKSL